MDNVDDKERRRIDEHIKDAMPERTQEDNNNIVTWNYQKTGASLKNKLLSSFFTHRATALAAPTAALLGNRGDSAMYISKG